MKVSYAIGTVEMENENDGKTEMVESWFTYILR